MTYLRVSVAGRVFELDARAFGGSPRLEVTRTESAATATLVSATYPGTDIAADLVLKFESLEGNARVRILSALGGFDATVPLLAWLEGRTQARSRVRLDSEGTIGDGYMLRLAGKARATLHPDFRLDLVGSDIVTLKGPRATLSGDSASVWLASKDTRTTLTRRVKRRTFVQIQRGGSDWQIDGVATPAGSAVAFAAGCFDLATVEAALPLSGERVAVVTLENSGGLGSTDLRFATGVGASPLASLLPLGNPRFGFICGDHDRFSFTADVADAASWVHRHGHSVLLGKHRDYPGVELRGCGSTAEKVDVKTALLGMAVPIEGVIASPITFPSASSQNTGSKTAAVAPAADPVRMYIPEVGAAAPVPGMALDAGSVRLTRPEDMLSIKLEFYNLKLLVDQEVPTLVRRTTANPSYLVVELPPQALLERTYYEEPGGSSALALFVEKVFLNYKSPPISARVAEPTRLAFSIPASVLDAGIPYTMEGLLNWIEYNNSVVPAARSRGYILRNPRKGSHYPLVQPETRIEAPWGVFLSPSVFREKWSHRTKPFTSNGVTELWHTSLVGTVYADYTKGRAYLHKPFVRVVWARGYRDMEPRPNLAFRNSFTTDAPDSTGLMNRWALVDIMGRYQHAPMTANRLTLTPLGAWLDLKGQWPTDDYMVNQSIATGVLCWEHRSTAGRDQYVRIVKAGRLFPFGHKASLVTITERKFKDSPDGKRTGYLIQRSYIFLRELEKTYNFGSNRRNRQCPFKKVVFSTRVTPTLKDPASPAQLVSHASLGATKQALWPKVNATGEKFLFDYTATDWDGRTIEISSPLIFLNEEYAVKVKDPPTTGNPPVAVDLSREINICDRAFAEQELIPLHGQKIAYSEPLPGSAAKDRRVLQTEAIRLRAENAVSSASAGGIFFYPKLHRAQVRLEDVEALMNTNSGTWIQLWDTYLQSGYSGNNAGGRVFAEIADTGIPVMTPTLGTLALDIPPDRTGGFATPNVSVKGLSATEGAFGGEPGSFGTGAIDATDFFSNANPTLFGDITLLDILNGVTLNLGDGDVPAFNDYIVERNGEKFARYEYAWVTQKFGDSTFFKKSTSALDPTSLTLTAFLEKNITNMGAAAETGVSGTPDQLHPVVRSHRGAVQQLRFRGRRYRKRRRHPRDRRHQVQRRAGVHQPAARDHELHQRGWRFRHRHHRIRSERDRHDRATRHRGRHLQPEEHGDHRRTDPALHRRSAALPVLLLHAGEALRAGGVRVRRRRLLPRRAAGKRHQPRRPDRVFA